MTFARLNPLSAGLGLLVAAACGALYWSALTWIATPAGYGERLAALREQTSALESAARRGREPGLFQAGAVCPGVGTGDLQALERDFAAMAPAGVSLISLQAAPLADGPPGRLSAVTLRAKAQGEYTLLNGWLSALAAGRPEVFVDRIDFVARDGAVVLNLVGKVFCWTAAE
jgi:hypothetical protein